MGICGGIPSKRFHKGEKQVSKYTIEVSRPVLRLNLSKFVRKKKKQKQKNDKRSALFLQSIFQLAMLWVLTRLTKEETGLRLDKTVVVATMLTNDDDKVFYRKIMHSLQ